MLRQNKQPNGFTIVELLIVIVVIGVLAVITTVAFSGIQTRASVSKSVAALTEVNKVIKMYHAENGQYPPTPSNQWLWSNEYPSTYIPQVVPSLTPSLPVTSGSTNGSVANNTYGYRSDGANYKVMIHNDGLCEEVLKSRPDMVASIVRRGPPCWAYGYWSPSAENW